MRVEFSNRAHFGKRVASRIVVIQATFTPRVSPCTARRVKFAHWNSLKSPKIYRPSSLLAQFWMPVGHEFVYLIDTANPTRFRLDWWTLWRKQNDFGKYTGGKFRNTNCQVLLPVRTGTCTGTVR